jgi:hypothetical protein
MAIVYVMIALSGCMPTSSGATISFAPGKQPRKLIDLDHLGQVPAGAAMCMPAETGCIETGWGPGWDLDKGREGQSRIQHASQARRSHELGDRAVDRASLRGGRCSVYWEQDEDLGSAPVGDCAP